MKIIRNVRMIPDQYSRQGLRSGPNGVARLRASKVRAAPLSLRESCNDDRLTIQMRFPAQIFCRPTTDPIDVLRTDRQNPPKLAAGISGIVYLASLIELNEKNDSSRSVAFSDPDEEAHYVAKLFEMI